MTSNLFGTPGPAPEPAPVETVAPATDDAPKGRNTKAIAFGVAGAVVLAAAAGTGAFFLLGGDDEADTSAAAPPAASKQADKAQDPAPTVKAPEVTSFNSRNTWLQVEGGNAGSSASAPAASGTSGTSGTTLYTGTSASGSSRSSSTGTSTVRPVTSTGSAGPATKGEKGDKGEAGAPGAPGQKGDKGDKGDAGSPARVIQVEATNEGGTLKLTVTEVGVGALPATDYAPGKQIYPVVPGGTAAPVTVASFDDANTNGAWDAGEVLNFQVNRVDYTPLAVGGDIYTLVIPGKV